MIGTNLPRGVDNRWAEDIHQLSCAESESSPIAYHPGAAVDSDLGYGN